MDCTKNDWAPPRYLQLIFSNYFLHQHYVCAGFAIRLRATPSHEHRKAEPKEAAERLVRQCPLAAEVVEWVRVWVTPR